MLNQSHLRWLAVWLLRVALAFSFLSAVADRFGLSRLLASGTWKYLFIGWPSD
jgi:hypothetical protein